MTNTSHETGVATQAGPGGLSATVAWCSCGWKAPRAYATRVEAQTVAGEHVAAAVSESLELMADAASIPSERDDAA